MNERDFVQRVAAASGNCQDRPIGPEESKIVFKHMVAMMLLLSMQSAGGTFPNVDFVKKNKFGSAPTDPGYLQERFAKPLRQDVYEGIQRALNTSSGDLGYRVLSAGIAGAVQSVAADIGAQLWCGSYPHDDKTAAVVDALLS